MLSSAEEFVRLRLSQTSEDYQRASHEEAPVAVWLDVIARFPELREWVVHNKTVQLEILEILAGDDSANVRATVASKRKLSAALFDILSRDESEVVRHQLACNKKAPTSVLELLVSDPVAMVREAALKRLGRT